MAFAKFTLQTLGTLSIKGADNQRHKGLGKLLAMKQCRIKVVTESLPERCMNKKACKENHRKSSNA